MVMVANLITATGGFLASVSLTMGILGYVETGVRLLFLAYAADILDGWAARRLGESSREGLMLDRAYDRVSQVIAPLVLYVSWLRASGGLDSFYQAVLVLYAGGLITIAIWRLVRRIVFTLDYFAGLPFFVHALLLITSILAEDPVNPIILLVALVASIIPIPYVRRLRRGATPSPGGLARLFIVLLIALLPYDNMYVEYIAKTVTYLLITYVFLGFLPPLLGVTPRPSKSRVLS